MMSKMPIVLLFGLIALSSAIDGYRVNENVEKTTREPSIQAYGLPKRFLEENGYIERIHGVGGDYGGKLSFATNDNRRDPEFTRVEPRRPIGGNTANVAEGTIEIFHQSDPSFHPEFPHDSIVRSARSIDAGTDDDEFPMTASQKSAMGKNDLLAEETKVFRPLFVYRQQVLARRQRHQQRIDRNANVQNHHPRRYGHGNSINASPRHFPISRSN